MGEHWMPELPRHEDGRPVRTAETEQAHARHARGPSRWRAALGLGPSRRDLTAALIVARYRQARAEAEMREAHVRAKTAEKAARASHREVEDAELAAAAAVTAAYEPAVDTCAKTRLHTLDEATAFAVKTATGLGTDPDAFRVYHCKVCPRHPATGLRFLHIANRDPQLRGEAGRNAKRDRALRAAGARRQAGNVTIDRIASPADLARLRSRFSQGAEEAS